MPLRRERRGGGGDDTHVVWHDRAQVDELDAQVAQALGDQRRELLARVLEVVQRRLDRVQRRTVRHDGQVGALAEDLGRRERQLVVARWDLLDGRAIQDLGLEEEDRVGVADGG